MGLFSDDHEDSYNEYQGAHKAKLSHELISAAASFEAAKAYEDHLAANGKPASHAMATELCAGFTGAFLDREFETHGLDYLDKKKAQQQAEDRLSGAISSQYEDC